MQKHGFTTIQKGEKTLSKLRDEVRALGLFKQSEKKELDNIKIERQKEQSLLDVILKDKERAKIESNKLIAETALRVKIKEDDLAKKIKEVNELDKQTKTNVKGLLTEQSELEKKSNNALDFLSKNELLKSVLDKRESDLNEKEQDLAKRENELLAKQEQVVDSNKDIEQLKKDLLSQEKQLKIRESVVVDKESTLKNKQAELGIFNRELNQREVLIKDEELRLNDKDIALNAREEKMLEEENNIEIVKKNILDKENSLKAEDKELKIREGLAIEAERMAILSKKGVKL